MARARNLIKSESSAELPVLALVPQLQETRTTKNRYPEIDALRGVAVIWMMVFHLIYDLHAFGGATKLGFPSLPNWYWLYGAEPIGTIFFLLLGVSAWLKYQSTPTPAPFSLFCKRGSKILGIAFAITALTRLISPQLTIYFGVLHCIGATLLLLPFFLKNRILNLILGSAITGAGIGLSQFKFSFSWLLWLGFWPESGAGADCYPLVPWFGVALLGIYLGQMIYSRPDSVPLFKNSNLLSRMMKPLCYLGSHSLVVYVIHQPIIFGILYCVGFARFH